MPTFLLTLICTFHSSFCLRYPRTLFLTSFHKESLPDLDDSAAGDCWDHLCFSVLVRYRCLMNPRKLCGPLVMHMQ